ncbi:TRADD-N-associated membrane domain-containing protein [Streptomyces decoyicus]|uniref:TRADD-N-associated membrane domain-containing protein n=1 Tax=Streptomyces decoyicus TaxID=249567 RepID=UPI0033BDAD52
MNILMVAGGGTAVTLLVAGTALMLLSAGSLDAGTTAVTAAVIGFLATATGAATALAAVRRQAEQLQEESRARVREAEQDLEQALRGSVIGGDPGTGAIVIAEDGEEPLAPAGLGLQNDMESRLTLPELWTLTHRRLDHYHGIALGQAKQSFRNAQIAMGLGFLMLVTFVIVALNASTTAGSIVAGGLGAVSAALAGYVSRTFVRSQEASAGHLRAYFDQPLEFSRYLAAERLMADARLGEEKRAEILSVLLQAMIAKPAAPGPAETSTQSTNAP